MANSMQIAKTVALPGRHPPMRMPSFPALERTAVMSFNASLPLTVPATATAAILTRQAYYPLWYEQPVTAATNVSGSYGVSFSTALGAATGSTTASTYEVLGNFIGFTMGPATVDGYAAPAVTGSTLTGGGYINFDRPVLGLDPTTAGTEYIYVPSGAHLAISIAKPTTIACNGVVTLERWQSKSDTAELVLPSANVSWSLLAGNNNCATTPWQATSNCWVRVRSVSVNSLADATPHDFTVYLGVFLNNAGPPTFTVSAGDAGSWAANAAAPSGAFLLPVALTKEFNNSRLPFAATRVTAVSALFTNVTKALNKEGTVLWGRLNPKVYDIWNDTNTLTLQALHPSEKAYLNLQDGCYSYCPPSTDLSEFYSYALRGSGTSIPSSAGVLPVYRLDNDSLVNSAVFTDSDGGTSLAVNVDWHIEFRTSSTLFQIGVSTLMLESLHAAQIGLLKAGFFFNNIDHVSILSSIIKAIGSLNPILRVAAPLAKGLLGASSVAVSKGSHNPRASTLATGSRRRRKAPKLPPFKKKGTKGTKASKSNANSVAKRMMGLNAAMRRSRSFMA